MASTDLVRAAIDAASDQRYPGTSDDSVARAQAIAGVLEPIGAAIEPLSTLDRGALVATVPGFDLVDNGADPTDPVVSCLLLRGRRHLRPDGVLIWTTPGDQRVPSRDLDDAVSNPVLRDAVALGGAKTEVGAGVEGGRW